MSKSIDEICKIPLRVTQLQVLNSIRHGKVNFLICPTGSGKSYIAAHLAQKHEGAMILCPSRALQGQYSTEMDVDNLWGRAHYHCDYYDVDCATCQDRFNSESDDIKTRCKSDKQEAEQRIKRLEHDHLKRCYYAQAKAAFTESRFGVTGVELAYFGIRNKSKCLIVDEAHNLISKLTNLSGSLVSSNSRLYGDIFQDANRELSKSTITFKEFMEEVCKLAEENDGALEPKGKTEAQIERIEDEKKDYLKKLKNTLKYIDQFSYEVTIGKYNIPSIEIKRLNLAYEFETLRKDMNDIYLMSATMPDVELYCEILGIDKSDINVVRADSVFSPDNVKVFCNTTLDLSYRHYDRNIDSAVAALQDILDKEPGRGIIHCTSFKQINDIKDRLSDTHKYRMIFDDKGFSKSQLLYELSERSNAVLISPAAYEGIDLKGELGTFSITFKAPFSALTPWIKAMNEKYAAFYHNQALSRFIQGIGRCLRSYDDKANIYLIDKCCGRFIKSSFVPGNIRKAQRFHDGQPIRKAS